MARLQYLVDTSVFARLSKAPIAAAFAPIAAGARELTILHYDADFELVAAITGQQHEWIVERGSVD